MGVRCPNLLQTLIFAEDWNWSIEYSSVGWVFQGEFFRVDFQGLYLMVGFSGWVFQGLFLRVSFLGFVFQGGFFRMFSQGGFSTHTACPMGPS